MPGEHHLLSLLCSRLSDVSLRLPLRAHSSNVSTADEYTSLHQLLHQLNITYAVSSGANSLLHSMRLPLHAGPHNSAFHDAYVHYAPFFEPLPINNATSSRDECSPKYNCCVIIRDAVTDQLKHKWYSDIEKALLICMCCFLGDRLRLLRHDSEYLKSLPSRVRTWLLDNCITSAGSPCTVVRPYTRVELKRHRVLRDVMDASFLDHDDNNNDAMLASPQPPTAQQKQMHVTLWYLVLCNGALQKAAVHAHKRLPHIRYMFQHYSAGEHASDSQPEYMSSQHSTLVGQILDNPGTKQRHRTLSTACVDFNNHLATGNNVDILEYFPDHAAIMLQVVRRVPIETQLVSQIVQTAQSVLGNSPKAVQSKLRMHLANWYNPEHFAQLLAVSHDYKLLSEIDLSVMHTCKPSELRKQYVFLTLSRQVAIRVLHWFRQLNTMFQLCVPGLCHTALQDRSANSKVWIEDISVQHDVQTCVVMRRDGLNLLRTTSLLAMLSTRMHVQEKDNIDFIAVDGCIADMCVQLCNTRGTNAALRAMLQLITGSCSKASPCIGFEKHIDTINRVHQYMFDMQYTQMETGSMYHVFWFLEAGRASNREFGGFSHMMLVLLLMPYVTCTVSKQSLEILHKILDKDTLRPIKRETSDSRRLKAAAQLSAELRAACRAATPTRVYCEGEHSPHNEATEVLHDSEKATILLFLHKSADKECLDTWRIHPDLVFACLSRVNLHLPCTRAYYNAIQGSVNYPAAFRGDNQTAMDSSPQGFPSSENMISSENMNANLAIGYALRNCDSEEHQDVVQRVTNIDSTQNFSLGICVQGQLCGYSLALPEFTCLDETVDAHIMGFLLQSIESETHSGKTRVSPKCPLYPLAPSSCPISSTSAKSVKPLLPSLTLNAISESGIQPAVPFAAKPRRPPMSASPMYSPSRWDSTDSEAESRSTHRVSHMSPRPMSHAKRHKPNGSSAIRDLR